VPDILQGNAVVHAGCIWVSNDDFITNYMLSATMKELWKSISNLMNLWVGVLWCFF